MKKQSKYDEMFNPREEVLIEYATMKDDKGRLKYRTPEIMRKFAYPTDAKTIDGFNRWLNSKGVYRCPKPKRTTPSGELFPDADVYPATELDADDGDYGQKDVIAASLNRIATELIVLAKAAGLPGYRIISIDDPTYGRS